MTAEHGYAPAEDTAEDLHNRIAQRAFEIYLERGEEHGCDLDDWLQAQREITGE